MTTNKKKSTGLGVIKHTIERLQSKNFLGRVFRVAIEKFLTLNQFEYEVFCNPKNERILRSAFEGRELFPLLSAEEVSKMSEMDIVWHIIEQIKNPTFCDSTIGFRLALIKLLNMDQEQLIQFVGPIPISTGEDKDARLDRDPEFSKYHSWAARNAVAHPGTCGVDG